MTVRRLSALPFLALLLLAAACDEGGDPTGGGDDAGSLAFSHAGTGEAPSRWETHGTVAAPTPDADWAAAVLDGQTLGISANRRTAGGKHDAVAIVVEIPSVGSTYTLGECDTCAAAGITFGQSADGARCADTGIKAVTSSDVRIIR